MHGTRLNCRQKNFSRSFILLTLLALPCIEASAQAVTTAKSRSANRLLEEVVVTAQKREEKLKDVPISVQAFSAEKMEALGIVSVQDIQLITPGFTVTNAAGFNITFLRGVGSDAYLPAVDSSVPFYLDGVPLLAIQGTSDTLGRVERVEVLKGPQGTLFGRNATGGTISIVTPDPDQEFYGDIKAEFGNWNSWGATLFANVPITENIAINGAVFTNNRDNYLTNSSTGNLLPIYGHGVRAKALWDISDSLSLSINGTKQRTSGNCALAFQNIYPALIIGGSGQPDKDPKFDREVTLDGDAGCQNESYAWGTEIEWIANKFDIKLMASRQKVQALRVDGPFDGTAAPIADAHGAGSQYNANQIARQDTIELQFLSNENTPLSDYMSWAAGMFYLDAVSGFDPIVFHLSPAIALSILPVPDGADALLDTLVDLGLPVLSDRIPLANSGLLYSESFSAYLQPTFYLGESFELTTGVRYQQEKRDLEGSKTAVVDESGNEVLVLPLPQGAQETLTPEQVSARIALQWRPQWDDNSQVYVSWARGWKNPTYNTVNLLGDSFGTMVALKAERVDTSEIGFKTQLWDYAIQLNVAAFYTEQRDPLSSNISITSGGVANFTNAGAARIKGAEADFLISPMPEMNPGLVVTGAVSYVNAIYTDFKEGRGYDDESGLGFGNGGANLEARDLSGNRIPRVPIWSAQMGFNQRINIGSNHTVEIGGDISFGDEFYFLPQESELSKRDDLILLNARTTYIYEPWQLEATAFINNIEDETYVENVFVSDFGTALMANDNVRLYGLRIKKGF